MKRFTVFYVLMIVALQLCLSSPPIYGQEIEQVIQLESGWNAVYLEVDPITSDCLSLFSDLPVDSVWYWCGQSVLDQPFTEVPLKCEDLKPEAPWLVYFPPEKPEAVLTTLHHILGARCYLIKMRARTNWTVRGRPCLPQIKWNKGSYNLVGFHVGDLQNPNTLGPSFAAYFDGSEHHSFTDGDEPIYTLRNGIWQKVDATESIMPGKAYWIYSKEYDKNYPGPLGVDLEFGNSIRFRGDLIIHTLTLSNYVQRTIDVEFNQLMLEVQNNSIPIQVLAKNGYETNQLAHGFVFQLGPSDPGDPDPNQVQITLGLQKSLLAEHTSDVLTIHCPNDGLHFQIPVEAEPSSETGLWVGIVDVNQVDQPDNILGDVLKPFHFRLMLHVDANEQVSLLNEVIEIGKPPTWMEEATANGSTPSDVEEGALYQSWDPNKHSASPQARRISSAAFSFDEPQTMLGVFGDPSSPLTCAINIDVAEPRHPYVHKYHPDHQLKPDPTNKIDFVEPILEVHHISNKEIVYVSWTDPNNEYKVGADKVQPKHMLHGLSFFDFPDAIDPDKLIPEPLPEPFRIPVKDLVTGLTHDNKNKEISSEDCNVVDVFDLGSNFVPDNEGWIETTHFGGMPSWKDTNGDVYDFFFFWFGGDEPLQVEAIFAPGVNGVPIWISDDPDQAIQIKKWNKTTGTEYDTQLNGVAFSITALKDPNGVFLTQETAEIIGLRFTCKGMSPACVCTVKPPMGILREIELEFVLPNPGDDLGWGDTWISGTYYETITGLIKKPVSVKGSFFLKHISRLGELSE